MPKLFGTDGVRGVANQDLTPDLVIALGRAAGAVLAAGGGEIVVGRDTRVSGPMLEAALCAGLCSAGAEVRLAGIVPTPAVAFLTLDEKARAGGVVSASHNPVHHNGIKFFSHEGLKVPSEIEDRIEAAMGREPAGSAEAAVGTAEPLADAEDRYVGHLLSTVDRPLSGLRVVLDCAYGAAWRVAPRAFREAGAEVSAIHAEPDGTRINVDCGSTSLDKLSAAVVHAGADLGLGFDGDADRVLAVDERGETVDGDRILGLAALRLHEAGRLKNEAVVTTVMANLGLRRALEDRGIQVIAAPVGDRFVSEAMTATGAMLGGEQSGHVIFAEHTTTGDGTLTGLQLAQLVEETDSTLSQIAHFFEPYPQVLINVPVADKGPLDDAAALWDAVQDAEVSLGRDGRVLVRASGTESLVRVMVEAADEATAQRVAGDLAAVVQRELD